MGLQGLRLLVVRRSLKPVTTAFLVALAVTLVIWVLRGLALLSFLPSSILWLLLLVTIGLGVFNGIQWTR